MGGVILSKTITELNDNPFEAQGILTQGKDGAHDICQWAVDNKLGSESSSTPWENTLMRLWNSNNRFESSSFFQRALEI